MTFEPVLNVLLANLAVMALGWLVQQRLHNAGIADLLCAASIGVSAAYYGAVAAASMFSQVLVCALGGVWAFRLVMTLLRRMLAEREDARYRYMRQAADGRTVTFVPLFAYRAVSATLFSMSLYAAAANPSGAPRAWTLLGAAVYAVGLLGQMCADVQLAAFRAQPRNFGRSCRRGLWRYCRHPNYFFEAVHWSAYPILAIGTPWPIWPLALCAPVLTVLEWIVAIPTAEAQALRTRGDDYRAYRSATQALLPWFPRGWPHDEAEFAATAAQPSPRNTPRRSTPVAAVRTPLPAYLATNPSRTITDEIMPPAAGVGAGERR